jgi:hypothetical protein
MTIQIHLTGARAKTALVANEAAAQEWAAMPEAKRSAAPPKPKPIPWQGFSGRGVRLRTLDADEKDLAAECAAKEAGEDGTMAKYNQLRGREMFHRCLVEVTDKGEIADLGTASWKKVRQIDLEDPKGSMSTAVLFTAKDLDFLVRWCRDQHDATAADYEAITGGAQELADTDG